MLKHHQELNCLFMEYLNRTRAEYRVIFAVGTEDCIRADEIDRVEMVL